MKTSAVVVETANTVPVKPRGKKIRSLLLQCDHVHNSKPKMHTRGEEADALAQIARQIAQAQRAAPSAQACFEKRANGCVGH